MRTTPYGELRYKGEYLPSLKSMDTKGLVIYLGTFSKILAPGYRLAWMCASEEIIQKINPHRSGGSASDLHHLHDGRVEVHRYVRP